MNKLTIIGNLTKEPENRTTQDGKTVCNFTVAVNRRKPDANGQDVDFFRVSAWGQLGENCGRYLAKGKKVCVVGRVSVRTFTSQNGETNFSLEVIADEVEFLTSSSGYTEAR